MAVPYAHNVIVAFVAEPDALEAKLVYRAPQILVGFHEYRRAEFMGFERGVVVGVYGRATYKSKLILSALFRGGQTRE